MTATTLILFNLFLACWLGLYWLIFSRTALFKINRYVLLSGILLAVLFSFVHFQWTNSFSPQFIGKAGPVMVSTGGNVVQPFPVGNTFPFWKMILCAYWAGVIIMLSRMMYKLWHLYKIIQKYPHKRYKNHVHIIVDQKDQIFSFTQFLFAPKDIPDTIYKHELIHIKEKHSFDNLLMELVKVFCWFNPFVYFYQLALKTVHEYLADAGTTADMDKGDYARLLVSRSFNISETTLVHHFFKRSQLQKRLIMLQKKNVSRKAGWKYLLVLPLIAALIFITSSSLAWRNKIDHVISKLNVSNLSPVSDQPVTVEGTLTDQEGEPLSNATVMLVGTTKGTITDAKGRFTLKDVSAANWLHISMVGYTTITVKVQQKPLHLVMYRQPTRINEMVVVGYTKEKSQPKQTNRKQAGSPFMFVEQMPSFPGGKDALTKYLHDHIKYPQQARKQHLEGTVIVNFVVEKNGSIKNIQTINPEIGGGLEKEAERIVKDMPKWHPAMQNGEKVNVLYTLPIRFELQ